MLMIMMKITLLIIMKKELSQDQKEEEMIMKIIIWINMAVKKMMKFKQLIVNKRKIREKEMK